MYTKKFYVYETAAANLSKIYFLKNAKKTCKPNNRDLNRDWINVIPNELEKYMSFSINNKLSFIDSSQFLSS